MISSEMPLNIGYEADQGLHQDVTPPTIISMAMTSRCNLRCVMCDHGIRNVKKEDFQPDLVDMAGDFIASASLVDLTGLGEPMLSQLFWTILDKFSVSTDPADEQFFLTFNSNGTQLNERNIERVLKSRIRKIRISLDSADPELFGLIRGTNLEPIVEGVRTLVRRRNELGRNYPKIGIEMTLMRASLNGVCDMIDLCAHMGVDFLEVWPLNHVAEASLPWKVSKGNWTFDYAEQKIDDLPKDVLDDLVDRFSVHARARGVPVLSHISGDTRATDHSLVAEFMCLSGAEAVLWNENSIRCGLPWRELRITYEGDVFACCWGPKPIGNLRTQTLESIWKGVAMRKMRSDLFAGVVPDLCSGAACRHVGGKLNETMSRNDPYTGDGIELAAVPISYAPEAGLYDLERYQDRPLRWTNGAAEFHVEPLIGSGPVSLAAKLWHIWDTTVKISVNGRQVLCADLPRGGLDADIDLGNLNEGTSLVIRIDCPRRTSPGDARQLGVPIESLRLISRARSQPLGVGERASHSGFPILD
jgi:MoaA/NifB/PqqE/SkfB family radical SAM enzyme